LSVTDARAAALRVERIDTQATAATLAVVPHVP
jgi:hypothetical protein